MPSATWRCASCGHDGGARTFPRLDNLVIVATPLGIVAMIYGFWSGASWCAGAGLALVIGPLVGRLSGSVWWWGGARCARCGYTEMLR